MNLYTAPGHVTGWVLGAVGTVATGLVAALVAATFAGAAGAPSMPTDAAAQDGTRITTACHITPNTWNVSADGPMWRCYRYLP